MGFCPPLSDNVLAASQHARLSLNCRSEAGNQHAPAKRDCCDVWETRRLGNPKKRRAGYSPAGTSRNETELMQ